MYFICNQDINNLKKKSCQILNQDLSQLSLSVDEGEVTSEASFTNDLGADSLDTVELIMEFEKEFNIAIPDDQAEKIATVGDAISYIGDNK